MPLYYFQLRTTDAAAHPAQCRTFPDLATALAEAQHSARSMIRNRMRRIQDPLKGSLDIEDEMRQPRARILLADVAYQIS
ncbi:MAG: hypothetical protein EOP62_18925 [Sphingomonadales bacterium]|nr:MAG: hypothetical protein EOP62_18925 [Sphingomonadales bacterium]